MIRNKKKKKKRKKEKKKKKKKKKKIGKKKKCAYCRLHFALNVINIIWQVLARREEKPKNLFSFFFFLFFLLIFCPSICSGFASLLVSPCHIMMTLRVNWSRKYARFVFFFFFFFFFFFPFFFFLSVQTLLQNIVRPDENVA
jgi:hypothetical protein